MAVRGCVILLFILLTGIVRSNDLVTSPLPAIEELSSTLTTSENPSTTTSALVTTNVTTPAPTTPHNATNSTTEPPITTHNTTNSTTEPPTTPHNTTNSTTEPPTTPHNTTNSTTEPPTTPHNTTNSTTESPTTPHHNITNSTTEAPTTNATTAPTAPPTTPPIPNPTVGNYGVKSDNATVCLMAKMGLQFSFKMNESTSFQTVNLDPNVTEVSGTCGSGGSDSSLLLKSEEITVHFVFTNVSQKFRLHALTFSVNVGNGNVFNISNNNLSLWEASVGSSYMCKKEQSYNITDKLTLNTFELQVQPFGVQNNKFNTAEECFLDSDLSFLVPIAVGVALSFLIILVLISYLIGRRKSRTGYQSV
ncbi:lysosome-associated membrane glycoprotein 2 isoform X2 [Garra rufa]|uniref:lysosome-associated membrane glycoprotein 2 isoform X2 n=1 Tax=Garra rufa TaxID=137080 RepID=UPI003CCE5A7E